MRKETFYYEDVRAAFQEGFAFGASSHHIKLEAVPVGIAWLFSACREFAGRKKSQRVNRAIKRWQSDAKAGKELPPENRDCALQDSAVGLKM